VRIIFPNLDVFLALKDDPVYKERIAMDHLNFADRKMETWYAPSLKAPSKPGSLSIGPATLYSHSELYGILMLEFYIA
jgi:hypothetical protein